MLLTLAYSIPDSVVVMNSRPNTTTTTTNNLGTQHALTVICLHVN